MSETLTYKWFGLTGTSQHAAQGLLDNPDTKCSLLDPKLKPFTVPLGGEFTVSGYDPDLKKYVAAFPKTFATPGTGHSYRFMMRVPVGGGRKDGLTHFTPVDGVEIVDPKQIEAYNAFYSGENRSAYLIHNRDSFVLPPSMAPSPAPQPPEL